MALKNSQFLRLANISRCKKLQNRKEEESNLHLILLWSVLGLLFVVVGFHCLALCFAYILT